MKKFFITLMCIVMVVCFMPTVAMAEVKADTSWYQDEQSSFTLTDEADLKGLAEIVNDGNTLSGKTIVLGDNITLTEAWIPIGTEENPFTGDFNGNGNTITGLTITNRNVDYAGLFGVLSGGVVQNIKFAEVKITSNVNDTGAAVGRIINNGTVSGVYVESGSVMGVKRIGGVVGSIKAGGTVKDCSNAAKVTASVYNVGGIVGAAYYTKPDQEMYVTDCSNTGEIESNGVGAGGIVGLSAANVSNCTNTGAVSGNGTSIGGIVGEQKTYGTVTNNNNSGAVTNKNSSGYGTGGIIGWLRYHGKGEGAAYEKSGIITVTGNRNTGSVSGGNDSGGIVGTVYNSAVITENTNSAEYLTATTFAAGIVGNYQITETPAAAEPRKNQLILYANESTTPIDNIIVDGNCKDQVIYTNGNEVKIYVAQVGEDINPSFANLFTSLQAAIAAAADGDTVTLLDDVTNAQGISIPSGKNFTLDFAEHTYTLTGPGAGSTNTETNGFQLLKDSDITFKNGTIKIAENANKIMRIIQNYANLKLEDMKFYAENQVGGEDYPLSFNNGNIVFSGNTSIITSSDDTIAFDVYYWKGAYPNGTSVTFDNSYTGTINGKILYDSVDPEKAKLVINGNGSFGAVETSKDTKNGQSITITGGKFNQELPDAYLAPGVKQDSNGNVYKPYYGGSIPTDSLKTARTEAIKAVTDYVNPADYEEAQQAEIKTIVDNAKKDIEAAKTADEIKAIEAAAKAELDKLETAEEMSLIRAIGETKFVARSKAVTLKNGKKAIRITWYDKNGKEVKFDGVEIFRSTKRYSGYGKEPIYVSKSGVYYNTAIEAGTKYYYKVRGYVLVNGEKVYTDYSTKAWRTVK